MAGTATAHLDPLYCPMFDVAVQVVPGMVRADDGRSPALRHRGPWSVAAVVPSLPPRATAQPPLSSAPSSSDAAFIASLVVAGIPSPRRCVRSPLCRSCCAAMTTAHRPTYHPAVGSANSGGFRFHAPRLLLHSRDLHAHTTLKLRQQGQASAEELAHRDLKQELIGREQLHRGRDAQQQRQQRLGQGEGEENREEDDEGASSGSEAKRAAQPQRLLKSEADGEERREGEEAAAAEGGGGSAEPQPAPLDLSAVDWSQFNDADAPLSEPDDDDDDGQQRSIPSTRTAAATASTPTHPF